MSTIPLSRSSSVNEIISAIVRHLVAHYHPRRVILFGSRARGTAKRGSDIDLEDTRLRRTLREELDHLAGAYHVDLVDLTQVDPEFLRRIEETGIVLHGRS